MGPFSADQVLVGVEPVNRHSKLCCLGVHQRVELLLRQGLVVLQEVFQELHEVRFFGVATLVRRLRHGRHPAELEYRAVEVGFRPVSFSVSAALHERTRWNVGLCREICGLVEVVEVAQVDICVVEVRASALQLVERLYCLGVTGLEVTGVVVDFFECSLANLHLAGGSHLVVSEEGRVVEDAVVRGVRCVAFLFRQGLVRTIVVASACGFGTCVCSTERAIRVHGICEQALGSTTGDGA